MRARSARYKIVIFGLVAVIILFALAFGVILFLRGVHVITEHGLEACLYACVMDVIFLLMAAAACVGFYVRWQKRQFSTGIRFGE